MAIRQQLLLAVEFCLLSFQFSLPLLHLLLCEQAVLLLAFDQQLLAVEFCLSRFQFGLPLLHLLLCLQADLLLQSKCLCQLSTLLLLLFGQFRQFLTFTLKALPHGLGVQTNGGGLGHRLSRLLMLLLLVRQISPSLFELCQQFGKTQLFGF